MYATPPPGPSAFFPMGRVSLINCFRFGIFFFFLLSLFPFFFFLIVQTRGELIRALDNNEVRRRYCGDFEVGGAVGERVVKKFLVSRDLRVI